MYRRKKKKKNEITLTLLGCGALIVLISIAIKNPWSIVSIIFILILVCLAVFWLLNILGNLEYQFKKEKQFKRISRIQSVPQMAFLTPVDFEYYVATIFEKFGYTAEVTKHVGDEGIDLILKKDQRTIAVQVKRYLKGNVSRPDLQKLVGASLNRFDQMMFVTTANYSYEAREYAVRHRIKLVDGEELSIMAEEVFGKDYVQKALSFSILQRK